MECQILFLGKNKKDISKYRLLKISPRVVRVNRMCALSKYLYYDTNFENSNPTVH